MKCPNCNTEMKEIYSWIPCIEEYEEIVKKIKDAKYFTNASLTVLDSDMREQKYYEEQIQNQGYTLV